MTFGIPDALPRLHEADKLHPALDHRIRSERGVAATCVASQRHGRLPSAMSRRQHRNARVSATARSAHLTRHASALHTAPGNASGQRRRRPPGARHLIGIALRGIPQARRYAIIQAWRSDHARCAACSHTQGPPVGYPWPEHTIESVRMHAAIEKTEHLESKAFDPILGEYRNYRVKSGSFMLQFLTHLKQDSEYLIVFFSSMKVPLPNPHYNRWTWAAHSNASCLYLHDCTSEELCCWYLGDCHGGLFMEYADLIRLVARCAGIPENKLIFIGSSTGGYAALRMSVNFPKCTVHASNPQTILKHYNSWGVEALERVLGCKVDEIAGQDITGAIDRETRIHYVQCREDRRHFLEHYLPFRDRLSTHHNISYELVSDEREHLFCPSAEDTNRYFTSIGMDLNLEAARNMVAGARVERSLLKRMWRGLRGTRWS